MVYFGWVEKFCNVVVWDFEYEGGMSLVIFCFFGGVVEIVV